MKPENSLAVLSLVNIVLMMFHMSGDIVYGYEAAGLNNLTIMLILAVWLYATLALAGRRSGHAVLVFGSLLAALMPLAHMSGSGVSAEVVKSSGGLFFLWGLLALGAGGIAQFALAAQGLWRVKRSIFGFVLSLVIPFLALAALLAAFFLNNN